MLLEEAHGLVDGLEKAAGLRLERERDGPPGALADAREVRRVPDQVARHVLDRPGAWASGLNVPGTVLMLPWSAGSSGNSSASRSASRSL